MPQIDASVIFTALIGLITAYLSYSISSNKNKIDTRSSISSSEQAFRDDLLEQIDKLNIQIDRQNTRISAQSDKIDKQQDIIEDLRKKNQDLVIERTRLEARVKDLEDRLKEFTRKVYYEG